jgi:hypothetical protein
MPNRVFAPMRATIAPTEKRFPALTARKSHTPDSSLRPSGDEVRIDDVLGHIRNFNWNAATLFERCDMTCLCSELDLTVKQMAKMWGADESTIYSHRGLSRLTPSARRMIAEMNLSPYRAFEVSRKPEAYQESLVEAWKRLPKGKVT